MTLSTRPRAVILDWDDTVVDTWSAACEALNATLISMNRDPWHESELRSKAGPSARDMFMGLFGHEWEKADKLYYDTFSKIVLGKIKPVDGAHQTLLLLRAKKIPIVVVSNKRGALLRREAEHLGYTAYFHALVGAGDAAQDKPDIAPVIMALRGSGIEPGADVWFIGDSHIDMQCAKNACCTSILLETKPPPDDLLLENPPAYRFKNHRELMEFLSCCFT